jgi:hypothetical protein
VFITPAVFVADTFTVKDRITVDAGLRFDYSRAINPDLPAVNAEGRETDDVLEGVGTVYTRSMLSPRLGVAARLDRRGHTVLRASYGRFNQGVLTGELDPISQGATATTTREYEATTGQSLLDLRMSKTLPVFGAGTADLILDVLNVLNDSAEEALVSDNRFATTFGAPRLFIDPRRAMLGVRVNLGQ